MRVREYTDTETETNYFEDDITKRFKGRIKKRKGAVLLVEREIGGKKVIEKIYILEQTPYAEDLLAKQKQFEGRDIIILAYKQIIFNPKSKKFEGVWGLEALYPTE